LLEPLSTLLASQDRHGVQLEPILNSVEVVDMTIENQGQTPEPGTNPLVPEVPTEPTPKPDANAELRAYNERLKAENQSLRATALRSALSEIGLSHEEGLGVAVAESYQGDEFTPEALAAFAQEKYKYVSDQTPANPNDAQQRVEGLHNVSTPVEPRTEPTQGQQAQQKVDQNSPDATRDDARASINAKANDFLRTHYPQNQGS
jgi:hypothetical protein